MVSPSMTLLTRADSRSGVGSGVFVAVLVGLGVLVGLLVGLGVTVGVRVALGVMVGVGVGVALGVSVASGELVGLGAAVAKDERTATSVLVTRTVRSAARAVDVALASGVEPTMNRDEQHAMQINSALPKTSSRVRILLRGSCSSDICRLAGSGSEQPADHPSQTHVVQCPLSVDGVDRTLSSRYRDETHNDAAKADEDP